MGYYLLDHDNPNAPRRSDGNRFWGYPSRNGSIRVIGVHTGENAPDFVPPDRGAESIASYLSRVARAASYHEVVDSDSTIPLLPEHYTAFGIGNFNSPTWHLSFATEAHKWGMDRKWQDAILRRGAVSAARIAKKHGIPAVKLTREQALNGKKGFVAHATMDPSRRSDPGKGFPWTNFFSLVIGAMDGTVTPSSEDDDMRLSKATAGGKKLAVTMLYQQAVQRFCQVTKRPDPLPQYGADGYYGQEMTDAVADYQRAAGIANLVPELGAVDSFTAALLNRYAKDYHP